MICLISCPQGRELLVLLLGATLQKSLKPLKPELTQCRAHKVKYEIPPGAKCSPYIPAQGFNQGQAYTREYGPLSEIYSPTQKHFTIQSALDDATQTAYLDSITKFDEAYSPATFNEDDEDVDIPAFPTETLRSADQLLSIIIMGMSEVEYMDVDDSQSEMSSENFNLEDIQDTSNNEDSDVALNDLFQQHHPSKPMIAAALQAL
ncbi:hypothetical protein HD554DRAFT_2039758 [Boletus coccyginus]|nr:hypothetical protein HD554DRAFT_2039758 [Boletus coccyginus]